MINLSNIQLWRLASIIAIVLYVVVKVILIVSKLLRNRYYQNFHEDELVKETETVNSKNNLYFTSGEAHNFISKYIISV